MKIKTVQAARVEEALNQIMAELGPEAIVVSARRVLPAPAWQVWQQPLVELVAVLPEGQSHPLSIPPLSSTGPTQYPTRLKPGTGSARLGDGSGGVGLDVAEKPADYAALRRELIRSLAQAAARSAPRRDWAVHHLRHLLAQGLDEHLARRAVMSAWIEALTGEDQDREDRLDERLAAHLQRLVRVQPPLPTAHVLQLAVFVGPPGAGKSTALARLALRLRGAGLRVGVIAIDGGRKPAAAIVSRVAQQLGLPLAIATSPEQFQRTLTEMQAADPARALLVDTPGCAPDDGMGLKRLASFLAALPILPPSMIGEGSEGKGGERRVRVAVQLVLSAAVPMEALSATALAFALLRPAALVWTHLDQAQGIGPLFNISHATGLPLTYLASGPRGVTDFVPAQPSLLTSRLLSRRKRQDE